MLEVIRKGLPLVFNLYYSNLADVRRPLVSFHDVFEDDAGHVPTREVASFASSTGATDVNQR